MKRKLIRLVLGSLVIVASCAVGLLVWAFDGKSMPPSLYKPELKREMTQEQRWKLDFELANEAAMKNHNSRRFDMPDAFEKRAKWFEETARWYPIADLMQQLIDFRTSSMRNNERAFNELVEMGKAGNISATCMAAMFYQHHDKEATAHWKYTYEDVAKEALKQKNSGHPVCVGIEGSFHLYGQLGYTKSRELAKPYFVKRALIGFYGAQNYLLVSHVRGQMRFVPKDVALSLCWQRVADTISPYALFSSECETYRLGIAVNEDFKDVPLPPSIQQLAREWCEPSRIVTAQTCADLELQSDSK